MGLMFGISPNPSQLVLTMPVTGQLSLKLDPEEDEDDDTELDDHCPSDQ